MLHLQDAERQYYLINRSDLGNSLEGIVDFVEMLGSEKYLYLTVEGKPLTIRVDSETKVKNGDKITVHLDENKIHLFDKET